ncbi:thioesterase II family protein [Streptomyces sp. KLMMK]|uniref:thioesterase II family protein n=1 Tax=Streptomyces sp. KLMMK TaxID=3109353 RepID=UPI00300BA632
MPSAPSRASRRTSSMSERAYVVQGSLEEAADVVVFLPPAGSVTSPYLPIGSRLPATLPAVHCEIPGRGRLAHDEAPASVHGAVGRWAGELAALLPGRRLHVFGHSLGALFAYELTALLEARPDGGAEVATLLVSGSREPGSAPRSLVVHAFAALRREQRPADREGDAEGARLLDDLRMRREHRTAGQRLRAPLALFCGRADAFARPAEMLEWKRFTGGPFLGMFTFDGGHDYHLSGRQEIAATISRIVNRHPNSNSEDLGVRNDG